MTSTPKSAKYGQGDTDQESPSPLPGGHKASFRSTKLARRARSFKDDFLEKISQMRTPTGQNARSHSPKEKHHNAKEAVEMLSALHQEKSPQCDLERLRKQVEVDLKHFRDVVSKNKLEMLHGNGTIVLDSVWAINLAVKSCAASDNSSSIVSATHHMYQSVARLIKLCDDVLIGGDQSSALQNENVVEVLEQVEYAVQNLIKLAIDKLSNGDACKTNPRASYGATNLELPAQRNSLPDIPLTPREREILEKTSGVPALVRNSHSSESIPRDSTPPPKPPLPERFFNSSMLSLPDSTPPPLPPKKRLPRAQQLMEECLSSDNSLLACSLDRMSLRSRSPEDSSSLLSASAGSVDSMLNHSREEEEDLLTANGTCQCCDLSSITHGGGGFLQHGHQHSANANDLQLMNVSENRLSNADSGFVSMRSHRSSVHSYTKRNSQQSSISAQWNSGTSASASAAAAAIATAAHHQHQSSSSASTSYSSSHHFQMEQGTVKTESSSVHQQLQHQQQQQSFHSSQIKQVSGGVTAASVTSFSSNATTTTTSSSLSSYLCNAVESMDTSEDALDSSSNDVTPPAIPEKTKKKVDRQPSPYDNVPESGELLFACSSHQSNMSGSNSSQDARPPPLPPKKKHIMAYMEMFGNCTHSSESEFMRHSMHMVEANQWQHISESHIRATKSKSCSHASLSVSSDHSIVRPPSVSPTLPPIDSKTGAAAAPPSPPSGIVSSSSTSAIPPALPPKRCRTMSTKSSTSPPPMSPTIMTTGATLHVAEPKHPTGKSLPDLLEHTSLNGSASLQTSTTDLNVDPGCNTVTGVGIGGGGGGPGHQEADLIEELDVSKHLVVKKPEEDGPEIRGGHIDALIIQATKATKSGNDIVYQEAFLTTYRTLISPFDLVCKLIRRHQHFYCQPERKARSREAFALLVRVVNDLTPSDLDEKLQQTLMDFVQQLITCGELTLAKALRVKHLERYLAKANASRLANVQDSVCLSNICLDARASVLLDFKSDQIAEQMTLLDAELFLKIEIPEVLIWAQEQNEERSPNLTRFTEHFNKMSYWARTRILASEAKDREKYVMKFIKIMKHLRKINNFNSYLALLSALDSAPIRRLEWQKHITEGLKEYCALIDSSSSFRAYRQALAETQPPCIPYIGLVLQDLTFVHIGNSDLLPDSTINFSKRWQQYNIVENMKRFKKGTYDFKKNDRIIKFFQNFDDFIGEDAMWQLSESIKPRGKKAAP